VLWGPRDYIPGRRQINEQENHWRGDNKGRKHDSRQGPFWMVARAPAADRPGMKVGVQRPRRGSEKGGAESQDDIHPRVGGEETGWGS
jgi:hypothetical protein